MAEVTMTSEGKLEVIWKSANVQDGHWLELYNQLEKQSKESTEIAFSELSDSEMRSVIKAYQKTGGSTRNFRKDFASFNRKINMKFDADKNTFQLTFQLIRS
jgi:hypothetical protein